MIGSSSRNKSNPIEITRMVITHDVCKNLYKLYKLDISFNLISFYLCVYVCVSIVLSVVEISGKENHEESVMVIIKVYSVLDFLKTALTKKLNVSILLALGNLDWPLY